MAHMYVFRGMKTLGTKAGEGTALAVEITGQPKTLADLFCRNQSHSESGIYHCLGATQT